MSDPNATGSRVATVEQELTERVHDLEEVTWALWRDGYVTMENICATGPAGVRVAAQIAKAAIGA